MNRVDIETVRRIQKERKAINSLPFSSITWFENGKRLDIPFDVLEEFEFTGLNNMDFITSGAYQSRQSDKERK